MLYKNGSDVDLRELTVEENKEITLRTGGDHSPLAIIAPISIGQSGELIRSQEPRLFKVRCIYGEVQLTSQKPNGEQRNLATFKCSNWERCNLRVNVTGFNGLKKVYRIDQGKLRGVERHGPVINLFSGHLELKEDEYAVTIELTHVGTSSTWKAKGECPLELEAGYLKGYGEIPSGGRGWFLIDTGASRTLITRAVLPSDTEIKPASMTEKSARGVRTSELQMTTAGGTLKVAGWARLRKLRLGEIVLKDSPILVVEALPRSLPISHVAGILGMDLLSQTVNLTLHYAKQRLILDTKGNNAMKGLAIPFSLACDHIIIRGWSKGSSVFLIIDTGAPCSLLSPSAAEVLSSGMKRTKGDQISGLDGNLVGISESSSSGIRIGDEILLRNRIRIADLPLFNAMGLQDPAVILGNDELSRFAAVSINFSQRILYLLRHPLSLIARFSEVRSEMRRSSDERCQKTRPRIKKILLGRLVLHQDDSDKSG